jgi:hypothetical protein
MMRCVSSVNHISGHSYSLRSCRLHAFVTPAFVAASMTIAFSASEELAVNVVSLSPTALLQFLSFLSASVHERQL